MDPSRDDRAEELEAQLRASRESLEAVRQEVSQLREQIRKQAAQRDELLTVVSHELRTPVTVIAGYNKLLLSTQVGPLNAEQRRFLEESTRSCARLSDFIGYLVEASSEVRGETALRLVEAPVEPILSEALAYLRPLFEKSGMEALLDLAPGTGWARLDAARIEQVLTNLVSNALKYAKSTEPIVISTRRKQIHGSEFVEIAVSDRGPGVASQDRERIFDPYVRLGWADSSGGLGLGLAICRRIIEAHGGELTVTEREGGGSRFAFTLPEASDSGREGD